jgi:hypothetical protein
LLQEENPAKNSKKLTMYRDRKTNGCFRFSSQSDSTRDILPLLRKLNKYLEKPSSHRYK